MTKLGYYPSPYPGELFQGINSRLGTHLGIEAKRINDILFDSESSNSSIDSVYNLSLFISRIPKDIFEDENEIITKYTLFPLYASMLSTERVREYLERMYSNAKSKHLRLPFHVFEPFFRPSKMRYCPFCTQEDRVIYGEAYWYRLHQAPGVCVCLKHLVILLDSIIPRKSHDRTQRLLQPAETVIEPMDTLNPNIIEHIDENNMVHKIMLQLTKDIDWLLNQRNIFQEFGDLKTKLDNISFQSGYPRVYYKSLIKDFREFVPDEVFYRLDIITQLDIEKRLIRFFNTSNDAAKSPILMLLLSQFFKIDREMIFSENSSIFEPFGRGPWPCLNRRYPYHNENVIEKVLIKFHPRRPKPNGYFECSCGFMYATRDVPMANNPSLKFRIIRFGWKWDEDLKVLWQRHEIGARQLAKEMNVTYHRVKQEGKRLGLDFPRPDGSMSSLPAKKRRESYVLKMQEMRSSIIKTKQENPQVENLEEILSQEIAWLKRYGDYEWLKNEFPQMYQPTRINSIIWSERVNEYKEKIQIAVQFLLNQDIWETTHRITNSNISRAIKHIYGHSMNLNALPTEMLPLQELLETLCESMFDYTIRRIDIIKSRFIAKRILPPISHFIKALSPRKEFKDTPEIRAKILKALEEIKESIMN